MDTETQEPRRATVGASVTERERWLVELVKRKTGRDISSLLREHSLGALIEWGQRLDEALQDLEPAA